MKKTWKTENIQHNIVQDSHENCMKKLKKIVYHNNPG